MPETPRSVKIFRCPVDYGPATKILPACKDLRGQEVQIFFCDDDLICKPGWIDNLFYEQSKRRHQALATYVRDVYGYVPNPVKPRRLPRAVQLPVEFDILYRMSRLFSKVFGTNILHRRPFIIPGYGDVFFGAAGVVVMPDFFDDLAFDIPPEAWPVDDVWLSANLARLKIDIYCPWLFALPSSTSFANVDALLDATFSGLGRQELNRLAAKVCQDKFGVWIH